jgi:hypothetical protein
VLASPLSVINETLDQLQTLSDFLLDEVDAVLIPKLEAVRSTNAVAASDHPNVCVNCDD